MLAVLASFYSRRSHPIYSFAKRFHIVHYNFNNIQTL